MKSSGHQLKNISKYEDMENLVEKWAIGELNSNDFLAYDIDSLVENLVEKKFENLPDSP